MRLRHDLYCLFIDSPEEKESTLHTKDFIGWSNLKEKLDHAVSQPTISEREIWWCSIGVNIGDEEDGKKNLYNRPILIVKKFNARLFWGVALGTKIKEDKNYFLI